MAIARSMTRAKVVTDPAWAYTRIFELEAQIVDLTNRLEEAEHYGGEGWAWLDDALAALGVETVFDIPKKDKDE